MKLLILAQEPNDFVSSAVAEENLRVFFVRSVETKILEKNFRAKTMSRYGTSVPRVDATAAANDVLDLAESEGFDSVYVPSTWFPIPIILSERNRRKSLVGILTMYHHLTYEVPELALCGFLSTGRDVFLAPSVIVEDVMRFFSLPTHYLPFTTDVKRVILPKPLGPADPWNLLYVGKVVREKGPHLLLDLAYLLSRDHRPVEVTIVGAGNSEQDGAYQRMIRKRGDRLECVTLRMLGVLRGIEKRSIWQRSTILVYPSAAGEPFGETFGLSVLESLSLGIPVLTSDCGNLGSFGAFNAVRVVSFTDGLVEAQESATELCDLRRNVTISEEAQRAAGTFDGRFFEESFRNVIGRRGSVGFPEGKSLNLLDIGSPSNVLPCSIGEVIDVWQDRLREDCGEESGVLCRWLAGYVHGNCCNRGREGAKF